MRVSPRAVRIFRSNFLLATVMMPMSVTAYAQDSANSGIEDIVVTAQKREESIQDVPIAVTALSGDSLQSRNITNVEALGRTIPGMRFSEEGGELRIGIRGLGNDNFAFSSTEGRVAYHRDGFYVSRPIDTLASFFDVARIEALRGPQGTLFGRNATGGSINLITRGPTEELDGYLQATGGNYDTINVEGALGGALAPGISARIAFQTQDHGFYGKNLAFPDQGTGINNLHTRAIRGKLRFEPTSALTIDLTAGYFRKRDRTGTQFIGLSAPEIAPVPFGDLFGGTTIAANRRDVYEDLPPNTWSEHYYFDGTVKFDITDTLRLVSLTGYSKSKFGNLFDVDHSSAKVVDERSNATSKQFSQELRLEKTFDRGVLIAGAYYFYEDQFAQIIAPFDIRTLGITAPLSNGSFFGAGYNLGGELVTKAYAGFIQGEYEVIDGLTLTVGGRYSTEKKTKIGEFLQFDTTRPGPERPLADLPPVLNLFPPLTEGTNYHAFTPKIGVKYDLDETKMIYATYSKGFKSGGYSIGYFTPAFKPEKLDSYEVGAKVDMFDRSLRINLAGFYYEYKDIQVPRAEGTFATIDNAASAKLYGAELEVTAKLTQGLTIDGSFAALHTEYKDYVTDDNHLVDDPLTAINERRTNLRGNRFANSPKFTANYGIQYIFPTSLGQFTARGEGYTSSSYYWNQYNRATMKQGGFTILNAFLNWESDGKKYYGGLYVQNITNKIYVLGAYDYNTAQLGFIIGGNYNPPRTYGAKVGVRF